MLFNSYGFFLFLGAILVIFKFSNKKYHKVFLLLSSYFFYAYWSINFALILLISTAFGYILSRRVYQASSDGEAKKWLSISIILFISFLMSFKLSPNLFSNFLKDSNTSFAIPLGISFYSFQIISYLVDIYRKQVQPVENIIQYALFISFFPQILAGPIERASNLIPQFNKLTPTKEDINKGLRLLLLGLFKKVIIADKLALIVNPIYNSPMDFNSGILLAGTFLFSFQIYYDFSGYTDIALGSARLFGVKLSPNFDKPYLAKSLKEFWHRWHITLSQWFRDYVYLSLGGNKVGNIRWGVSILIVFILSGIWHGVGYTFLAWGALHGLAYLLESVFLKHIRIPVFLSTLLTFLTVSILWIFFRSNSIGDSFFILTEILSGNGLIIPNQEWMTFLLKSNLSNYSIILILGVSLFYIFVDFSGWDKLFLARKYDSLPTSSDFVLLNMMIILFLFIGDWGGERFMYFQF